MISVIDWVVKCASGINDIMPQVHGITQGRAAIGFI